MCYLNILCVSEMRPTQQPCDAFQCFNNKCLSLDHVCNLHNDCHDGEDESAAEGCGESDSRDTRGS